MTTLTIDIVSDLVCPWCFIGKRNLEAALKSMGAAVPQVNIIWHPFQLNPDLPLSGISRQHYIETKFGGPERAAQIYNRVKAAGQLAGLELQFDRILQQPNTLVAHTLVILAQAHGRGNAVVKALFKAYFESGIFIGDVDVLADIGAANGLNREEIIVTLNNAQALERVATTDAQLRQEGITSVPFFVFGKKINLSGAQPPDLMREAITQALQ